MRNPGGKEFSRGIQWLSAKEGGIEGLRKNSAEARLLQIETPALESEEIALPAGPSASLKTGGGQDSGGFAEEREMF